MPPAPCRPGSPIGAHGEIGNCGTTWQDSKPLSGAGNIIASNSEDGIFVDQTAGTGNAAASSLPFTVSGSASTTAYSDGTI